MDNEFKELEIVYRDLSELKEPDYNPRKINARQKEDIRKSLTTFGFVQPLLVNTHEDRLNIIIGGNQRKKIAESIGLKTAPCIEVCLDLAQEKELNVRLNKNQAEFDMDLLKEYFERDFLFDVGFSEKEVGKLETDFDEKFKKLTNDTAEMPVVPKFSEKYGCIIIPYQNDLDENWLRNILEISKAKDYKNVKIAIPYVISVQKFQEIWEKATNPTSY